MKAHNHLKIDHIVMHNMHHDHQSDAIAIFPLEIEGWSLPSKFTGSKVPRSRQELLDMHQSITWLWLSFLSRLGLQSPGCVDAKLVESLIDRVREPYVEYKEKYEPKKD